MNKAELDRLLEKYYEGESTDHEEEGLKEFFNGDTIPDGYSTEKEIFGYYIAAGMIPRPSVDFEERILAGIDSSQSGKPLKTWRGFLPYMSAAAGILLLAASYFFLVHRAEYDDSFKDPEIAYAQTMKILIDVSSRLNHATQVLEPVGKINEVTTYGYSTIKRSTSIINKNLKNLDYFNRAIKITGLNAVDKVNK
jgi:hypothetical protein